MPSKDLISKLQSNNNVIFETARIKSGIAAILAKTQSNRVREAKIGEFIKIEYADVASKFEFNKARDALMGSADVATSTSLDFFKDYMEIITEMVKETSDELSKQAKETREKAEAALADAQKEYESAKAKYDKANAMDMDKALGKEVDKESIMKTYKDKLDQAGIAQKNAQAKLNGCKDFKPYAANTEYFGISEADANKMLETQVNSAVYMNVRKSQLDSVTATDPAFMDELKKALPKDKDIDYTTATAGEKRRIHHVYATRQLMKDTLASKTGFWGWVWRTFSHRAEAKAMRNYIKEADAALKKAHFGENETDITAAENATTQKGVFYEQYKKSGAQEYLQEKFVVDEKKAAMIKEEQDKIADVSKLPLADQFFEIKFRPSTDTKVLGEQVKEFRKVTEVITKNKDIIPKDVMSVFKMNSKKLSNVKDIAVKKATSNIHEAATLACEEAEDELIERGNHDNYKPMTYTAIKALVQEKEPVVVDFNQSKAPQSENAKTDITNESKAVEADTGANQKEHVHVELANEANVPVAEPVETKGAKEKQAPVVE